MAESRSTFAPVVLAGLASGALAAYVAGRSWVSGIGADSVPGAATTSSEVTSSPLGTALALVVLACWGVVLVTQGRFRRAVTALGVLTSLGYAATVAAAPFTLPDHLLDRVRRETGAELDGTTLTGWFWVAVAAAVLVLLSTGLALRLVPGWPEMGAKYDAPAGRAQGSAPDDEPSNLDMWKALDEGRDPTA